MFIVIMNMVKKICGLLLFANAINSAEFMKLEELEGKIGGRIQTIEIQHRTFSGGESTMKVQALDVACDSIQEIFKELYDMNFPIYSIGIYNHREIRNDPTKTPSIHDFGLAIDVNPYMNPSFYAIHNYVIPQRSSDYEEDKKQVKDDLSRYISDPAELDAIHKTIIQEKGSDDRFMNRGLQRPGMITPEIAQIFKKHGFNIWGGNWRQPMCYMIFQTNRRLAESLVNATKEEAQIIWNNHISKLNTNDNNTLLNTNNNTFSFFDIILKPFKWLKNALGF